MRGKDRRLLWLVLDGAADRPAAALDGRTPLEAADTPNLDRLAAAGVSGTMDVGPPGTPLSSDRAHAYLFGYTPADLPGRGVLEARGFGLDVPAGGVACSASFGRVRRTDDGTWTVTDRHLRDVTADYRTLAAEVERFEHANAEVTFAYTWKNRGIVTLAPTDAPLSPAVTDVDPFEVGLPVLDPEPLSRTEGEEREAARRTREALAAYTRHTLDQLSDAPVDAVVSKWAGAPTDPPSFAERHGLDAASLTPKPVLTGLARTLGMAHVDPPEAYEARADRALAALDDRAFVHVHYPEPDEVSHAAGPAEKRDELAAIDATFDAVVDRSLADEALVTVVTADHTTPSNEDVVHSGEPVPVTMAAETVRTDDTDEVGERPAATGGLGRIAGRNLLRLSRAAADRVLLDGLRRSPAVHDYPDQSLAPLTDER